MEILKKIAGYLNPIKLFQRPEREESFNLRAMHFINKIAIMMFIIALAIMISKYYS